MSDRDIAIGRSIAIEQMLTQLGAVGSGLGQKSISLQYLFTGKINHKFKFICLVWNKAAHEVIFEFDRMDRFVRDCDEVQSVLNELIDRSTELAITQNLSQPQLDRSHDADFSIPSHLIRCKELTFSAVTGRLIKTQDRFTELTFNSITGKLIKTQGRSQIIKASDRLATTRNQTIWLRSADGQEICLELVNCVVEPLIKDHLLTLILAKNQNTTGCLAVYSGELGRCFYCTSNIQKIRSIKWYSMVIIPCLYLLWMPTGGLILSAIIYYVTKFLVGENIGFLIGFLCSFIILPIWLVFRWQRNISRQVQNHVDRIIKAKSLVMRFSSKTPPEV